MNVSTQQFGSVLFIVVYFNSMFVPCSFYRDRNSKGRRKIYYEATAVTVQSNQTEVYRSGTDNGAARGHDRYPRQVVANLPLAKNLNLKADRALEREHHSFTKPFGGYIALDCDTDVTKAIFKQYARASRQWVHNNNALEIENDRMVYQMGLLTIQGLKTSDQGVFICRIEYEPKQFKSVALFTLVVESNDLMRVQETSVMTLQSNSASLGYIFPSATRAWWHIGNIVRSNISASQASDDRFLHANTSIAGYWTCIVSHQLKDGTKRTWKTARYVVHVTPPPSKLEQISTYCSMHPVTIVMCGLVIGGFILVLFVVCVSRVDKEKMQAEEEMDKMKERLLPGEQGRKDDNHPNVDRSYKVYQAGHGYDRFPTQENEQDYYQYEHGHNSNPLAFENDDEYNYTHENKQDQ
ncbi:uncharacterized protein LOC110443449 isoform X1 [Mizuhopecten yessoensis]|uniref:Contactin-3 n=1 Tax=Mizuhopecten yessoensis TaxID=6573 RepID=A0A210PEZ4_MIZYE|nr:uncharacterized protein LOC110443449 isoform X1 [Mizuhopecten yessoensis]OWF35063.1 Contactin-3 [Mizuhopecten yessoensis]